MSWINSWRKRQKITIDHTKIDENLQNFPVKVILPNDSIIFDYAQADGADIRFTASDGATLLDFEREVHNKTEKIAVYHVKIPSISSTSDTDFYIYYDNPIAEDASNPSAVWDENYELVMHMTPDLKDSTSKGNDGTNYGAIINLANDGYYASFDGVDDYILISSPTSIPVGNSSFTQEVYYLLISYNGNKNCFISWGESSDGKSNALRTATNTQSITGGYCHYFWGTNYGYDTVVAQTIDSNTKYFVTTTYNGSNNLKIYHNGGLIKSNNVATPNVSATNIGIGKSIPVGSEYLKGSIYEVRISSIARSDAWIKATSESLHNTLLTLGEIETSNKTRMQVVFIRLP